MQSVLFIQFGDYRGAYRRFAGGGEETYRDQKVTVDFVASLAPRMRTTTACFTDQRYREELAPDLWAVGLPRDEVRPADIARVLDEAAPSHVVLRTPHIGFLQEVQRRGLWLLPTFADIFSHRGPRRYLQNRAIRRALLRSKSPCYSNHSLNASRSMVSVLGLPPDRVVPWDWSQVPLAGPPKTGVGDRDAPSAFFAGAVTEEKGVGDCLEAVVALRSEGIALSMSFAGPGDLAYWAARAGDLGISEQVRFLGQIPNAEVRRQMHGHDFVVVPSRHSYAEGLPNTIYEGLASRSVLIVSDHPAFAGRLEPGSDSLVFPAGDGAALARCFKEATEDSATYQRLSQNSESALGALYVGMDWLDMVEAFLRDPENREGWVEPNTLARLFP